MRSAQHQHGSNCVSREGTFSASETDMDTRSQHGAAPVPTQDAGKMMNMERGGKGNAIGTG